MKSVVVSYSIDGRLIRKYPSARQASIALNVHPRSIDKCIRGDCKTIQNKQWRRFPSNQVPNRIESLEKNKRKTFAKSIDLVNENNEIIKSYSSIRKAALDNDVDPHSIRDVLNGKYQETKGKRFRYSN